MKSLVDVKQLIDTRPKLVYCSIIVPVYEEEENIPILHKQITEAMQSVETSYEVIYVDDGSRDASYARLLEISQSDPNVTVVQFRRNFGQTAALAAGIDNSNGEIVVFMERPRRYTPPSRQAGRRLRPGQRVAGQQARCCPIT